MEENLYQQASYHVYFLPIPVVGIGCDYYQFCSLLDIYFSDGNL